MTIYGFNEDRSKVDISQIQDMNKMSAATGILAVSHGGTGAATANANRVFAGPQSGSAAAPAFRALVAADIPNISTAKLTSGILPKERGGTGSATASPRTFFAGPASGSFAAAPVYRAIGNDDLPVLTEAKIPTIDASKVGKGILDVARIPSIPAGKVTGTLAAGNIPNLAESKITNLATDLGNRLNMTTARTAKTFLAGPKSGNAAAPTFRTIAVDDLPTIPVSKTSGTLPVNRGGTGKTTVGMKQVLIGSATQNNVAPTWRMVNMADINDWNTVRYKNFGNQHGKVIHAVSDFEKATASRSTGWDVLGNVTIPETGLWLVLGAVEFTSNHNGERMFKLSTQTTDGVGVGNHLGFQLAAGNGAFHTTFAGVARVTSAPFTWKMCAFQNSGSKLNCGVDIDLVQLSGLV